MRIQLYKVFEEVMESLIQAGAADSLEGHRAQLMESIDLATTFSQRTLAHRANGQTSIFDSGGDEVQVDNPQLPDVKPWSQGEQLTREKELLGFYFSGHPLSKHKLELQMFTTHLLDQILKEETIENFYSKKKFLGTFLFFK